MAWTGQSFTVGQILTANQMNNLQADITAAFNKDTGAPTLVANYITTTMITDANVTLAKLASSVSPWVLLQTNTISSGATSSFTSLMSATYSTYMLVWEDIGWVQGSSGTGQVYLRFGVSGSYPVTTTQYTNYSTTFAGSTYAPVSPAIDYNQAGVGSWKHSGRAILYNPYQTSTVHKSGYYDAISGGSGISSQAFMGALAINTSSAVDSVQLYLSGGSTWAFTSGTARLYGLRK